MEAKDIAEFTSYEVPTADYVRGREDGKEEGIKQVAEWFEENIMKVNGYPAKELWQAQLKEWGK